MFVDEYGIFYLWIYPDSSGSIKSNGYVLIKSNNRKLSCIAEITLLINKHCQIYQSYYILKLMTE